jgi:hypothetical protein
MTAAISSVKDQKGYLKIDLTGAASAANAGLGSIANPEGCTLGITRAWLYFVTGSTGAANLDIGITTVAAKGTDIVSSMDVIQATVGGKFIYCPAAQVAETEDPTAKWTATTYLTFTGSATTVGLVGYLYLEYIRLP